MFFAIVHGSLSCAVVISLIWLGILEKERETRDTMEDRPTREDKSQGDSTYFNFFGLINSLFTNIFINKN
jgi:hypothetical protein